MVIDAGKGIESQTLKLFEVCRARNMLELIDEIEKELQIFVRPMNWPLGNGSSFRGVYDRQTRKLYFFERGAETAAGASSALTSSTGVELLQTARTAPCGGK